MTILKNDGMLVNYFLLKGVPEHIRAATLPMIKGISALHSPEVADAGLVEGECFIIPDGMPVGDAESLSFLLAPDGGLYFPADDREYGGSLPYRFFQAAMTPCRVTLKNDAPLPVKEFMASLLRTQPAIRMAPGEAEGKDIPVLFFLPPDGAEKSESFLTGIFGSTEPLRISLTEDELDAELAAHGRKADKGPQAGLNFSIEQKAFSITMTDMVGLVEEALEHEIPALDGSGTVAGIPLDYIETIAAQPNSGKEFVFYRAPRE